MSRLAQRGALQSRFGFYFVAIGSAVGLGNLWRFPYVVGENGGGAFVLLYVLLSLVIGTPLLIAELTLGRTTGKSVILASREAAAKFNSRFRFFGWLCVALSLIVLSYYSVISGWVLHFTTQFFLDLFTTSQSEGGHDGLAYLLENGWLQMLLASAHILISIVVVIKGVHEGLEKWLLFVMPFFLILVGVLLFESFSQPSSIEVLRFLFYPDFSKLTLSSLGHALGHVFFTLSVGFGTMVTFGSYLRGQDHIPTTGLRVTVVDTIASILAAVLIFPIVFAATNIPLTDPAMMFEALPGFLRGLSGGNIFGLLFFICLYLAALNASIGLLEVIVSNFRDMNKKVTRPQAVWFAGLLALVLTAAPSFSSSNLKGIQLFELSLLELLDSLLINWLLPIAVLGISIIFLKSRTAKELEEQFVTKDKFISHAMFPHWFLMLKWGAPLVIGLGLLLQLLDLILAL